MSRFVFLEDQQSKIKIIIFEFQFLEIGRHIRNNKQDVMRAVSNYYENNASTSVIG